MPAQPTAAALQPPLPAIAPGKATLLRQFSNEIFPPRNGVRLLMYLILNESSERTNECPYCSPIKVLIRQFRWKRNMKEREDN